MFKSYDPYGVVAQMGGTSQSTYGYTGEQQDSYIKLINLRSRLYSPYLNQFIQPDSIVPDPYQPADWNRYLYTRDNPVNYGDPSGLCPSCYIFYFPGVGNPGDPSGKNDPFAYLSEGEQQLINELKIRTGSNVEEIYPYGNHGADWFAKHFPNLVTTTVGGDIAKIVNIPMMFLQVANLPQEVIDAINCGNSPTDAKISFIGYSGGSQVAYNTAQQLTGKMFIQNFVAFGPIYRAYNQLNNIGHIWELVGQNDERVQQIDPLWHDYNSGIRYVGYHHTKKEYYPALDIYRNGAVRCTLFGTTNSPYHHADTGSYVDTTTYDNGMDCGSGRFSPSTGYYGPIDTLTCPHKINPKNKLGLKNGGRKTCQENILQPNRSSAS